MQTGPRARIVSCNQEGEAACASAARISTTQGSAEDILTAAQDSEKNRALIAKVLRSGHKSTLEHAVFTLSMCDVSVFTEQFFIESRLASFTVKSRRYVDFGGAGFYIPPELEGEQLRVYRHYMELLFAAYRELLELGVPKEDARFLLPYAFHSSFYCTLNARELASIIRQIRFGRGQGIPELQAIAAQLTEQLTDLFPALLPELTGQPSPMPSVADGLDHLLAAPQLLPQRRAGGVSLHSAPQAPLEILHIAHEAAGALEPLDLPALLRSQRPRELEQLSYIFLLSDVTLSGITHIVRHRMQSIIVPPIVSVDYNWFILPDTIAENPPAHQCYVRALEAAHGLLHQVNQDPALRRCGCYFALSGNMLDLMTTINARELLHFMRLRTCNRAQWEIRAIATEMLQQLRESFPELFSLYGPGCCMDGHCPEGALTCGKMEDVITQFAGQL